MLLVTSPAGRADREGGAVHLGKTGASDGIRAGRTTGTSTKWIEKIQPYLVGARNGRFSAPCSVEPADRSGRLPGASLQAVKGEDAIASRANIDEPRANEAGPRS
ncbi:hypothetical protein [Streptomyces sp. NPDC050388]|uniref:hypothetical protein n=1 Tax=Streptomyces sp. NPDC050388 TaxID=3155781 RepID=UPI0034306F12